jgi:predicted SAM-dependent methyltransferase
MKALIRKTARKMADWPGVGRLIRIAVAVIRLPEFRDRLEHALMQQRPAAASDGYRVFESEQLPGLLQAVSEVNHRQIAEANAHTNLVRSVPVSLRKMMREIVHLREENARIKADAEARLQAIEQSGQAVATQLAGVETSLASGQQGVHAHVNSLAESVQYLLGRVEFVRRELMFEMRYGATAPDADQEQLSVKAEILDTAKVDQARQSSEGIRLNLGCGHVPLAGYLNVDRRALPGVDVVAEVDQLPFGAGEVAEICSAHLLEHFPQEQLRRELLPYWVSLLRAGGVFRAIVPDGGGMARAYVSDEYPFDRLRQVTFGGQDYDGDFHYNMFTTESLSELLREAGFTHIDVVAENRENGGCKEFELRATR